MRAMRWIAGWSSRRSTVSADYVLPEHGEVIPAVPLGDEHVHPIGDGGQRCEWSGVRRLEHEPDVLARHGELEAGRIVGRRHVPAAAGDDRRRVEEVQDLERVAGRHAGAVRDGEDVGTQRRDADDVRVAAELVDGGEVRALAEVLDSGAHSPELVLDRVETRLRSRREDDALAL